MKLPFAWGLGVAIVLALLAGPAPAEKPRAASNDVTVRLADYEQIRSAIEAHKGKVVVMDCWSTWCEPCVKEFPGLVKLHKKYGPKQVACISVSFDYDGVGKPEDFQADVLAFLEEQGATFENLLASEDPEQLFKKLEIPSIPAVFVFDRQGKLAQKFDDAGGAFSYDDVAKLVARLVAKE